MLKGFLHRLRGSPNYPDRLPCMPCSLPRRTEQVRVGFFPVRAAFPSRQVGRRPRLHFRGLLKLHSRYGLQGRLPAYSGLLSRGFDLAGYPAKPLSSFHANRQLHGWNPPPPVIYADSAHCEITGNPDGANGDSPPIRPDYAGVDSFFGLANLQRRRLNRAGTSHLRRERRSKRKLLLNNGQREFERQYVARQTNRRNRQSHP